MINEEFRVAMVGVSTELAKRFLAEIFCSQTTRLVAVCDENRDSLRKICEKYIVNGYRTFKDLTENEEVDFIIITNRYGTKSSEIPGHEVICKK